MRYFRFFLFTVLNAAVFFTFYDWYSLYYYYYFTSEIIFIPELPYLFIYLPIFLFQLMYQSLLLYELLFKKFITSKVNYAFAVPIVWGIISLGSKYYDNFEKYELPETKIQKIMEKIQFELESYRVKTQFYPKYIENFNEIKNKITNFKTGYTKAGKELDLNIVYLFDYNEPYINNKNKYEVPTLIVAVTGSGKNYFITSFVKTGYINGFTKFLEYKGKPLILQEDIMIRKKIRDNQNDISK